MSKTKQTAGSNTPASISIISVCFNSESPSAAPVTQSDSMIETVDLQAPLQGIINEKFKAAGDSVDLSGQDFSDWVSIQSLCARLSRSDHGKSAIHLDNCSLGRHGAAIVARSFTHVLIRAGNYHAQWLPLMFQNSRIRILSIANNKIGPDGAAAVAKMLRVNTGLKEINLKFNGIRSEGAQYLASALCVNTGLQSFSICGNELCNVDENGEGDYDCSGIVSLANTLQVNHHIKTLKISENDLGDEGIRYIGEALRVNQSVMTLDLHGNSIFAVLENSGSVTTTVTTTTTIGDRSATEPDDSKDTQFNQANGSQLPETSINELSGASASVSTSTSTSSVSVAAIASAINDKLQLKQQQGIPFGTPPRAAAKPHSGSGLSAASIATITALSQPSISHDSKTNGQQFAEATSTAQPPSSSADPCPTSPIRSLSSISSTVSPSAKATGAFVFLDALLCNTGVLYLDLSWNELGAVAAGLLGTVLSVNKTLRSLHLGGNPLGDIGLQFVCEGIRANPQTSLMALNIESCSIGIEGARALADLISNNNTLAILNASFNMFGTIGGLTLAAAMKTNRSIRSLRLRKNGMCDTGAVAMASMLTYNTTLVKLSLKNNFVGNDGAMALSSALLSNTSLKVLDISQLLKPDPAPNPGSGFVISGYSTSTSVTLANPTVNVGVGMSSSNGGSAPGEDGATGYIGSSGVAALIGMLMGNASLLVLNLEGHPIPQKQLNELLQAMDAKRVCTVRADYKWGLNKRYQQVCDAIVEERELQRGTTKAPSIRMHILSCSSGAIRPQTELPPANATASCLDLTAGGVTTTNSVVTVVSSSMKAKSSPASSMWPLFSPKPTPSLCLCCGLGSCTVNYHFAGQPQPMQIVLWDTWHCASLSGGNSGTQSIAPTFTQTDTSQPPVQSAFPDHAHLLIHEHASPGPASLITIVASAVGPQGQCRSPLQVGSELCSYLRLLLTLGHSPEDVVLVLSNSQAFDAAWKGKDPKSAGGMVYRTRHSHRHRHKQRSGTTTDSASLLSSSGEDEGTLEHEASLRSAAIMSVSSVVSAQKQINKSISKFNPLMNGNHKTSSISGGEFKLREATIYETSGHSQLSSSTNPLSGHPTSSVYENGSLLSSPESVKHLETNKTTSAPPSPLRNGMLIADPEIGVHVDDPAPSEDGNAGGDRAGPRSETRRRFEEAVRSSMAASVGWSQMPKLPALWTPSNTISHKASPGTTLGKHLPGFTSSNGLSPIASAVFSIPELEGWVLQRHAAKLQPPQGKVPTLCGILLDKCITPLKWEGVKLITLSALLAKASVIVHSLRLSSLRHACKYLQKMGEIEAVLIPEEKPSSSRSEYDKEYYNYPSLQTPPSSPFDNSIPRKTIFGGHSGFTENSNNNRGMASTSNTPVKAFWQSSSSKAAAPSRGEVSSEDMEFILLDPGWVNRVIAGPIIGAVSYTIETNSTNTLVVPSRPSDDIFHNQSPTKTTPKKDFDGLIERIQLESFCANTDEIKDILNISQLLSILHHKRIGAWLRCGWLCIPSRLSGDKLKWLRGRTIAHIPLAQVTGDSKLGDSLPVVTAVIGRRIKAQNPFVFVPGMFCSLQSKYLQRSERGLLPGVKLSCWRKGIGLVKDAERPGGNICVLIEQAPMNGDVLWGEAPYGFIDVIIWGEGSGSLAEVQRMLADCVDSVLEAFLFTIGKRFDEKMYLDLYEKKTKTSHHSRQTNSLSNTTTVAPLIEPQNIRNNNIENSKDTSSNSNITVPPTISAQLSQENGNEGTISANISHSFSEEVTGGKSAVRSDDEPLARTDVGAGAGLTYSSDVEKDKDQETLPMDRSNPKYILQAVYSVRSEIASKWLQISALRPGCVLETLALPADCRPCAEYYDAHICNLFSGKSYGSNNAQFVSGATGFGSGVLGGGTAGCPEPDDAPVVVMCDHQQPRLRHVHLRRGYILVDSPGKGRGMLRSVSGSLERTLGTNAGNVAASIAALSLSSRGSAGSPSSGAREGGHSLGSVNGGHSRHPSGGGGIEIVGTINLASIVPCADTGNSSNSFDLVATE